MFVIVYSRFEATARLQSVEVGALMPGFSALNLPRAAGTAVTSTRTSLHNAVHCIQEWSHQSPFPGYITVFPRPRIYILPLSWIYSVCQPFSRFPLSLPTGAGSAKPASPPFIRVTFRTIPTSALQLEFGL